MDFATNHTKNLTQNELRDLVRELNIISREDAPANVKQSSTMRKLFTASKRPHNYFMDQYSEVRNAINSEILWRFEQGIL